MTNRQGLSRTTQNSNNIPDPNTNTGAVPNSVARNTNNNTGTIPNSVARNRARSMGSSMSLSRRGNASSSTSNEQRNDQRNTIYNQRYSRRTFNFLNPIRNRSSNSHNSQPVRETTEPTPPRRSARISSRLTEQQRRTPTSIPAPTPPPLPPPRESPSIRDSGSYVAMSFPVASPSHPVHDVSDSRSSSTSYSDPMEEWQEFTSNCPIALAEGRTRTPAHRRSTDRSGTILPSITPQDTSEATLTASNSIPDTMSQTSTETTSATTSSTTSSESYSAVAAPPPTLLSDTVPPRSSDETNTDLQSSDSTERIPLRSSMVEIVRVVPHRLIQIPPLREEGESVAPQPRPPSGTRPQSRGSILLQRARRLLRDNSNDEPSNSADVASRSENMTRTEIMTPPIRRGPFFRAVPSETTDSTETPGSSTSTDHDLRRATFLRAESELISGMLNSTSATDRLSRLRLLRMRQSQEEDTAQRDRIITGLLGRREPPNSNMDDNDSASRSPPLTRLRMLEIPGQGAILMEDVRPETSLRMSLVQAQYLQEVLLRISSLLDNLHILSQMHERIEGNPELTTRIQSLQDDPRLQTFLAIATLDPDNMTYEQLLMLDDLLPKNQGASKEIIATKTSLLQYHKSDVHENDSCIVCITDFEENEGIRLLPCCHIYHIECIDTWLKRKKTCPMCRCSIEDKPHQIYVNRMDKFRDFKKQ